MSSSPDYGDLSVSLIVMSSQSGGTEMVVRHLSAGLHRGGADVDVTSISPDNLGFLASPGVTATALPQLTETGSGYLKRLLKDRQALRRFRGRKVNLHYPFCDLVRTHIMAMRLAGVRDIYVSFHHPQVFDKGRQPSIKKALSMCRRLIVTTAQNREFVLREGLAEDEWMTVVLPGIEFPPRVNRLEARKSLGLPEDKFLVGCLARIAPEKRVDLAAQAVAAADGDAWFVLGGDGSDLERVAEVASPLLPGRFRVLGRLDDPAPFLASLDAFILLSELEGFGLVYAEAAAQGVPSIACATGGTGTAILDGRTGYLVPVDVPVEHAAQHLRAWIANPELAKTTGENAHAYVTGAFSKEQMAQSYADVFRSRS